VKLKSNPGNPAYSSVFQPNYTALFDAKPNIVPTLELRLHQALSEFGVNLNYIAQRLIPSKPPWLFRTPGFDNTLYNVGTKCNTSPDLYHSLYMKLVSENCEGYDKMFTDGSKQGICVAAAAVSHDKVLVRRLPNHASIFPAEAITVLLAMDIISQSTEQDILILSDSLSCVNAVENRSLENPLVVEILERVHQQLHVDRRITFVWVPSHIGIAGNTVVDAVAKTGFSLPISNAEIPHTDFKPLISSHVKNCWQLCWNSDTNNRLFKIQPVIKSFVVNRLPRREEILIHRLRVGHTYLTFSYLLRREIPLECDFCHVRLTVEHLLLSCCKYNPVRRKFYDVNSLQELFETFKLELLVTYKKR
jgi:ribonuclease HI